MNRNGILPRRDTVVIPVGMDCRDPNQLDPLIKTFRGAALKSRLIAVNFNQAIGILNSVKESK